MLTLIPSNPVNPFNKSHGAPDDEERHVGDLGNFKTDGQGNVKATVTDKLIKLIGPESVLGVCNPLSTKHAVGREEEADWVRDSVRLSCTTAPMISAEEITSSRS